MLTRLPGCAGWSVPLLFHFACNRIRVSHDEAHVLGTGIFPVQIWRQTLFHVENQNLT